MLICSRCSEFDLGKSTLIDHKIDTAEFQPFTQQLRRHTEVYLQIIDDRVEEMRKHGIIEPTSSPWASNLVLVKKSYGDLRFCIKYRKLNLCTIKDSYPSPRIDICIDVLLEAQFFSTLDLLRRTMPDNEFVGVWSTAKFQWTKIRLRKLRL